MSPITHFLASWAVANTAKLEKRDRMLITLAGVIPDIDGVGVVWDILSGKGGYEFYQRYHHVFGHNLLFSLMITFLAMKLAERKPLVAALTLLSFHLHLLCDIAGSRGMEDDFWGVPYFWPFSGRDYYWSGQWALNGWQNVAITCTLMALTFYWAWKRGYSPLEIVSEKADQGFVKALRMRFKAKSKYWSRSIRQ